MKNLTYVTVPVVCLALLVLSCGQIAPTAPSQSEVVPPPIAEPVFRPVAPGNCCPEGFDLDFDAGDPADRNGDTIICRKVTPGRTITIDNNVHGDCPPPCIPPCDGV